MSVVTVIPKTAAAWAADPRIYDETTHAYTTDGADAGKFKVFDGVNDWSSLDYFTPGAGGGGVTSVSGTAPIASSGGATPAISLNDTAVTPGSYTNANITVDAKGRLTSAASGSGGVSDGDKGDITVSGSGATWTIDNDVVTNAKAANMAQSTIKGRAAAAGTGDPTDLTPNEASTILDGATDPFLRTSAATGGITELTGDGTAGPGSGSQALTLATVNSNVGSFGSATAAPAFTVNAKGLITAASTNTVTPAVGSITGLGTGVATALAVNVGTAGAPVVNGGALGTPSSGTATNLTGTASGLSIGGNAATATSAATLTTPRAINGVNFDGSAAINVPYYTNDVLVYRSFGSPIVAEAVNQPILTANQQRSHSDGVIQFCAVYLPVDTTLTGVVFYQNTQGNFTADNENSIALYSYSGGTLTRVAISANDGNIWKNTANTFVQVPFTGTYAAAAGAYFVGMLYNNSAQVTAPSIQGMTGFTPTALDSPLTTNSAKLYASKSSETAQGTSYASSALAAVTNPRWCALY